MIRSLAVYRSGNPDSPPAVGAVVAARLDDAARLCGRVGHDFDNVLMGVLGFAELTQAQLDPSSRAAGFIRELLLVAENAKTITAQLHAFHHCSRASQSPTRLTDVCKPTVLATIAEAPTGLRIESTLPANLPSVAVGIGPLQAVIGHLIRNAAEAMPAGGQVSVTGRAVTLTDGLPDALPAALDAGDYIELSVADAGPGFAPDLLSRVGREPFLTTKARHRGLGLPTVLRTLHAHRGGLRIESKPRGTAVIVYLPSAPLVSSAPERLAAGATSLEVSSS
jgi:signal transduction histidine kinase